MMKKIIKWNTTMIMFLNKLKKEGDENNENYKKR